MTIQHAIEVMEEVKYQIKKYGEIALWLQEDAIEAINVLCSTVEKYTRRHG